MLSPWEACCAKWPWAKKAAERDAAKEAEDPDPHMCKHAETREWYMDRTHAYALMLQTGAKEVQWRD